MTHLCQNLKLLAFLVKIDESISDCVRYGCVNHCQVREECTKVWNGAITPTLKHQEKITYVEGMVLESCS